MSISAHLAGITAEHRDVGFDSPLEARRSVTEMAEQGFALVELDLPIGKLALPRDLVDRAILARVTRGPNARPLLFVRGHKGGVVPVKWERVLDREIGTIALRERFDGSPIAVAASLVLERGPTTGKALLREARAEKRGGASTTDTSDLAKALVRAWNDGLVELR